MKNGNAIPILFIVDTGPSFGYLGSRAIKKMLEEKVIIEVVGLLLQRKLYQRDTCVVLLQIVCVDSHVVNKFFTMVWFLQTFPANVIY